MNIRTHSGNTTPLLKFSRFTDRKRFATLAALLVLVLTLGGCATGNSESADEAATRDASQATNVVGDIEQTRVATIFFSPTMVPTPYPTQLPTLANLRLSTSDSGSSSPGDSISSYSRSDGTLYAAAQIARLHPGQTVLAVWMQGNSTEYTSQIAIDSDHDLIWISLPWPGSVSASSGDYSVHIQVFGPGTNDDGTPADVTIELGSLVFSIS